MSVTLPVAQLSNVPWRRAGVKYTTNDMFLDLTEEVDAIVDPRGGVVAAGVSGRVSFLVIFLKGIFFIFLSNFFL